MSTTIQRKAATESVGALRIVPFLHPQGCRTYLVADPVSKQAAAIDVHLDLVDAVVERVKAEGWSLPYVIDTHTHADHPSGAGGLSGHFSPTRIAHAKSHHAGVTRHPADGEHLHLGDVALTIRHTPGHTPDHLVVIADGALFAGDSLLIGGMARTDFLGGDAGQLFDSVHALLETLPDDTVLYPGHDYAGRTESTIGAERKENPWLQVTDRARFVEQLTANPPQRPANMDDLLRLNREGVDIPTSIPAAEAILRAQAGGATSIIDVRTAPEIEMEGVAGVRHIQLDQIERRIDEVMATPAPRLLFCRTGSRAEMARQALVKQGVGGLTVIEGGIEEWKASGGDVVTGRKRISLERQLRIIIGGGVVLGAVLALTVHPLWVLLCLFMGAGLLNAGITDLCPMATVVGRMPWNRASGTGAGYEAAGGCAAMAPAGGCAASAPAPDGGCAAAPPPGL
jgi:glyoxylase-like metal-dependent hydrolase (beta-lactamase superfamily II)